MPGSRGKDFRIGDLAEGLGLELLRPFAFIAPVPRPEDVGIDAVATLFRADGKRLVAEDSFLVHVKAASVRNIHFEGSQLDWLRALTLPLFWLSVDLATTTIELWSMIRASGHPNFRDWKSVTIYLEPRPSDTSDDEPHMCLQKPILRWTPTDASSKSFQQTVYEVLKGWIEFEMKSLAVRSLGMTLPVTWETNCVPRATGAYTVMHHPSRLPDVLEAIRPHIQTLAALSWPASLGSSEDSNDNLLVGLLLVSDYMRQHGVDPDPKRILQTLVQVREQQQVYRRPAANTEHSATFP